MCGFLLFPFWPRRPLRSLMSFYDFRGQHRLPIVGRKIAPCILFCFFSPPVAFLNGLRRRSFHSPRQRHYPITIIVGTWMTFDKMSGSSKAHAGGLCSARFQLSPWPSTATVATWGRRFGANVDSHLGFACTGYIVDTCTGW